MPSIPMICPECSAIFEGPAYIDNSSIDMTGALVTCYNCKKNVVPIGGKYEHLNGVLRVIDSEDDEFINDVIAIYTSNINNEQKLKFIERLFEDKRGKDLEKVADEEYNRGSVKDKLLIIWKTVSYSKEFTENVSFIQKVIDLIKNTL